jgi:HrpA-like RNA helicase
MQRKGRAGRTQAGHVHRLYSKDKHSSMKPHLAPEVLRVPLDALMLRYSLILPCLRATQTRCRHAFCG